MAHPTRSSGDPGRPLSRRGFLAGAATASIFTIARPDLLGGPRHVAPNDKLNVAGVGICGKGDSDLSSVRSENIVALCDVDEGRARRLWRRYPDATRHQDYRVMLDKEDQGIDAVIVATSDHTHACISMEAMRRGKHVYCQKPLTHTVREAREMAKMAKEKKVATQMGNQGQASEATRRIQEIIQAGAIGPVREAHVWTDRPNRGLSAVYWPQGVGRPADRPATPAGLAWDLFLGPAPVRPYHPSYHPFKWRGWWDFGTGALGDIGCHSLDPVFRALELGHPRTVEACSSLVNRETYPLSSHVQYRFPPRGDQPAVKLHWYDGGMRPPRPDDLPDGVAMGAGGTLYVGDEGYILNHQLFPESRRKEFGSPERTLPRSPGHYEEWLRHAKGGEPGGSNFSWAGPLTEVVLLGNVALRPELREKLARTRLQWDPEGFRFPNLPEADRFLHTEYRDGWVL